MLKRQQKIVWLTPDYFLNIDAKVVPRLAHLYNIEWIVIVTRDSQRTAEGLLPGGITPKQYVLRYRQRDPRIVSQYVSLLSGIRRAGYDLLYTSFHGLPYFLPVLSLLIDVDKVIWGVHNVHTPKGAVHERAMRMYQRFAFAALTRFQVFSKYQLRTIEKLLPNKRHYYAPLGPDDYGPSHACPPRDKVRFLFFGYIRRYKRLDLLIEAFQALHRLGMRNCELVIAGECDDWAYYEALIDRTSDIEARIGLVPNGDIPDLLSSCHYVVLPYQDSAQSAVLSLAYQYNKPVVVSDIEAFKDDVVSGSTGVFFESLSKDSLTGVMRDIIVAHNVRYPALTESVRAYVTAEWSIDGIVARYQAFLDDTLRDVAGSPSPWVKCV